LGGWDYRKNRRRKMVDNDLHLSEFNKNPSKLSFTKEIASLEFVEIIGNMTLSHCVNYKKRDAYLRKHGKKLFRKFPLYKNRDRKLKIKINYQTKYELNKKNTNSKFLDNLSKTIKNIFGWKIIVTIDIKKYKYGSQEEIDMLLMAINSDDEKKSTDSHHTEVLSQEEIDELLAAIDSDDEENIEDAEGRKVETVEN
jgi:hypothetical protein